MSYNMWLIHFPGTQKELHENFLFPKVCCVVSLYTWIQENGCIIKEKTPTLFRNYRPSAKGLHLIDTFSACTGEKPERNLIPYFSRFSRTWTKKEHCYDTNTLGKNIIYINNIWIYNICIFIVWINYIEIFFYWIFVCIFAVWSYKYGSSSFKSGNFFRWYWL